MAAILYNHFYIMKITGYFWARLGILMVLGQYKEKTGRPYGRTPCFFEEEQKEGERKRRKL